jgi:hypothetical protein
VAAAAQCFSGSDCWESGFPCDSQLTTKSRSELCTLPFCVEQMESYQLICACQPPLWKIPVLKPKKDYRYYFPLL